MNLSGGSFWLLLGAAGSGAALAHVAGASPFAGAGVGALALLVLASGAIPGIRS
jgi:hypothetical protein